MKLENELDMVPKCKGLVWNQSLCRLLKKTQEKNKLLPESEQVQIGQKKGAKLTTKKSIEAKKIIREKCKDFSGSNNDIDCMKLTGLSRNTYYKYKREIWEEISNTGSL